MRNSRGTLTGGDDKADLSMHTWMEGGVAALHS